MTKLVYPLAAAMLIAPLLSAADDKAKYQERLNDSTELLSEVMSAPDKSIPQDLLNKAACIVLVPGLKKAPSLWARSTAAGLPFAAAPAGRDGELRRRSPLKVEAGAQIGVSSSDVILLVMNQRGMQRLMSDKFTIGADATAAAGPVGRNATAQTDAMMTAEILSWSRSRGAFIGASLDGATLRGDTDLNEAMYGKRWTSKEIIGSGATPPAAAGKLLELLAKYSMRKAG